MATTDNKHSRRMEDFYMLRLRGKSIKQADKPMGTEKLMEMLDDVEKTVVLKVTMK